MRNIPLFKVFMAQEAADKVKETLNSGFLGQGSRVEEFEHELGSFLGTRLINSVNSCTSALHLALRMLDHLPGSVMVSTALTCTASNWIALQHGLKLRWVDVDPTTCNIDIELLPYAVKEDTKAVMVVHWGGYPIDMDRLATIMYEIERKLGRPIYVIEDAAHAFGSTFNDQLVGTFGNTSCFSFGPIKLLSTSDAGLMVSPNRPHYERAKLLRWYGIDRTQPSKDLRCHENIKEWGYKYSLSDVTATIGLANLPYVKSLLQKNRQHATIYFDELKNVPGMRLMENIPNKSSSYWLFSTLVDNREELQEKLRSRGIQSSQVHVRNDKHTCLIDKATYYNDDSEHFGHVKGGLPSLDKVSKELLCLPVGWWLTDDDVSYIVKSIKEGW